MHKIAHRHARHISQQGSNAGASSSRQIPTLRTRMQDGMQPLGGVSGQRRLYSAGGGGNVAAPKWADMVNQETFVSKGADWAALINAAVGPRTEVRLDTSDGRLVNVRDLIAQIPKEKTAHLPLVIVGDYSRAGYRTSEDL